MTSSEPTAPNDLDLTIDFVNTADFDRGEEALSDPGALARWLSARGLLDDRALITEEDLAAALELREALRRTMLANNGADGDPGAAARLDQAARRGELGVSFAAGAASLQPRAPGAAGALAAVLVPVAEAMADGTWARVKACRADDCQWAFYDFSRNRSGAWCDMAVCGNREKVRAYRERSARRHDDGAS